MGFGKIRHIGNIESEIVGDLGEEPRVLPWPLRSTIFADALSYALKNSGLSLRAAARAADLSPSYLSRILNGKRRPPSHEIIIRLARILSVAPEPLLAEAGLIPASDPHLSQLLKMASGFSKSEKKELLDKALEIVNRR